MTSMTLARFEEALGRYGHDLRRWPASEADAVQALCEQEPEAARMLGAAARLEDLLREATTPAPVTASQLGRLAHSLERRRQGERRSWFGSVEPRRMIAAFSLALVIFGMGGWLGTQVEDRAAQEVELAVLDLDTARGVFEP